MKKCEKCGQYLIPYDKTWLHSPESDCELIQFIGIDIEVTKPYEVAMGVPEQTFNDYVRNNTLEEKTWTECLVMAIKKLFKQDIHKNGGNNS